MKIALPQLNYLTGDIQANTRMILDSIKKAKNEKAELIVFPEMAICGAFPHDLLEQENFINSCRLAVDKIAEHCTSIATIIGSPHFDAETGILSNSVFFIQNGEVIDGVHKSILSDYDIFDESRYFIAGEDNSPIKYKNQNIRVIFDEYEAEFIDKQDSFVVHVGLSPFSTDSLSYRQGALSDLSRKYGKTILSVNHVGAAAPILFDGNSMVYNTKGNLTLKLQAFKEDFATVDLSRIANAPAIQNKPENRIGLIHDALLLGISDYFRKHGFQKAILGLSGGIDSAVVATLAVEAIGKENVMGVLMPSQFSTDHSVQDALDLVHNLGISHEIVPIKELYDQYLDALKPVFKDLPFNVAEENLQARVRGTIIMALSNKFGHIPFNTSNKSEAAVGYGTLYGDLCGSLSVIGDVYKTDVFKLARYINRKQTLIPENSITKAPSAELRPDQKDQDSLPDYETLDAILNLYIEENQPQESILKKGFEKTTVEKTLQMVNCNEYKRAQCPPNLRVSKKAFGQGRQLPF